MTSVYVGTSTINEWMDGGEEIKYAIKLLGMIFSICHKNDETKQGTMALIETDIVLYTMWEKSPEYQ